MLRIMQNETSAVFGDWDGSPAQARLLQAQLAKQVRLDEEVPAQPSLIAGFDVGFEDGGLVTRAAAVLLDARTLQPLETHVARLPTSMPYVPGLLSFRELPALVLALSQLSRRPGLVFVDGHGIAHPRRLGIAAHFGVATGLPSIGVAKKRLVGDGDEPGPDRGDRTRLTHRGETIGWMLRSKPRCKPLFVSPGHRVSLESCADWVMRYVTRYRLPEPTRLADRLASRRGDVAAAATGDLAL
ncbi:deoxyribonuclease V [Flavobacterium sp. MXW15]|nr:deoxyribonuclease V [Flavobacterium sp. MXW15]